MNEKEMLQSLLERGIISTDDVSEVETMQKRDKVLEVHPFKITQNNGKDARWVTRVMDGNTRRKIQKKTEKELIDALYDYYYSGKDYKSCTLESIYDEWLDYKTKTCKSINTVYRLDADYKKYYKQEPLSDKIMTTPLLSLTVADVKEWGYEIIKKYNLTHKAWMNVRSVIKQVCDYLMDKDLMEKNPVTMTHIPKGVCRVEQKKEAKTQIFYADEIALLVEASMKKAEETKDTAFLAIPLFCYTGMRIGECLALNYVDLNRKNNTIHVDKMVSAKTEKLPDGTWAKRTYEVVNYVKGNGDVRDVLITPACMDVIDKIMSIQREMGKLSLQLFQGVTPSNVQFKLYRLCDALGLSRRSPHKWRKTYISTLLNKGLDPDFVRVQVGHKDLQTTLNSYTYSTTRKEKQLEQLEECLSM